MTEAKTTVFCVLSDAGEIVPAWNAARDEELRGVFEAGLTVDQRYLLREQLGSGAMGRVFLAHDLRLDRAVALKVVVQRGEKDPAQQAALREEALLGASLNHRGIAAVLDCGFHEDKSWTVFEFVEGETLRALLQRRGTLPVAEVRRIVEDLAVALDFAHSKGIVHRDLKPENICLTRAGEFKILDLGLAQDLRREPQRGGYAGTPAYSSPEQAACRHIDGRSDQYALAVVAFEMLTGRKLFNQPDPLSVLRSHQEDAPPDPQSLCRQLPDESARALLKALAKNPDDRYPTCQEFAYAVSVGETTATASHTVRTAIQDRIGFYICHGGEESLVARQIAEGLESSSYRCWYYARDTLPGIPSPAQSQTAIERSQALVLLISRSTIRTGELDAEIEAAHTIGCPVLAVLVDLSREEFEKLNPPWRTMLGVNAMVEHQRLSDSAGIVDRLQSTATALAIEKDATIPPRQDQTEPRTTGQRWATDANQIEIGELNRVIYQNDLIRDFLEHEHRYFLVGTKGLGKTLVLTRKRQMLTESQRSGDSLTLVPEGRPYLDFMTEMRSLSAKYQQPLSELSTTKRLWSAAIRISAISHHPGLASERAEDELEQFPPRIQRWLCGTRVQPTVVFKELTALQVSQLNRLIDRTENLLDQEFRRIHGGTLFFIDKVDQAIRHLSRDAWITIQAGLIEAAWEIMNANSHVKIYATIRQEAFSNYQSDIKSNLFGATTSLEYTTEELCDLLDTLSAFYEGSRTFADFIGMNVIRHPRRSVPEDSFRFVRRHCLGRPRDLVAIASELSRTRSSLNERSFRRVVERSSAAVIVSNIFDEVRVFLDCLHDHETQRRFFAMLRAGILARAEAVAICEDFNGLERGTLSHFGEDSPHVNHPFRDLFSAGLLGYVEEEPESGDTYQRFRRPYDPVTAAVPESPFYFVHPALNGVIVQARAGSPFVRIEHVAVGDALPWRRADPLVVQIERLLADCDPDVTNSVHESVAEILASAESGRSRSVRSRIRSSPSWERLMTKAHADSESEIVLWLEELLDVCEGTTG